MSLASRAGFISMKSIFLCIIPIFIAFFPLLLSAESASHIVISEVQITGGSGKSTDEFIELYNPTEAAVLMDGWQLMKKTGSGNEYVLVENFGTVTVPSHSFFLIAHPAGYFGTTQPDLYYSSTNSIADNNTVILLDNSGTEIDKIGFGSASDFEGEPVSNPGAHKSVERKACSDSDAETMVEGGAHFFLGNGEDSDSNVNNFISRSVPEPQNLGSEQEYLDIVVPEIPERPEEDIKESEHQIDTVPVVRFEFSEFVIISELFPNPEGSDDKEFIELHNVGDKTIDLIGWQLGDTSTRRYTIQKDDFLSTQIASGDFFVIEKKVSGISLNNTTDAAVLYWPDETEIDRVEYSNCKEAQSYSVIDTGLLWTDSPTPGLENKIVINNELPIALFELENEQAKVGQMILFDGSESSDLDKDSLEFFWNFGNGDTLEGEKVDYSYPAVGTFTVILLVRDEKGGEDEIGYEISVTDYDYSERVIITELLPSCSPSDKECEFIEVFNAGNDSVSLEGWQLTDLKTHYMFPFDSVIQPSGYFVIERSTSKVTLNNSSDLVYLIDPKGVIINGVEYEKSKKDMSFSFDFETDKWHWTESPTPGTENEIIQEEAEDFENSDVGITAEQTVGPVDVAIADISEAMMDQLVRVHGEVESVKSTGIYIMDELGNTIRIYIQKKTGISKPDVEPGDYMEVVGVVSKTSVGLRILPRTVDDIVIRKQSESEERVGEVLGASIEKQTIEFPDNNKAAQVKQYLYITIGALVVVFGGVLVKIYLKKKQEKEI